MATSAFLSVAEYLSSDLYEPAADYVDGEIEERPAGGFDHSTWQQAITRWFLQHDAVWNIRVRCELRIQVSPTRYRIPDVVVFDRSRPIEQMLTHPPIALFEVLSPEDRISRLLVKWADYAQMGVQTSRVIQPATSEIFAYERGALIPVISMQEDLPSSPCSIDWKEIRALLDF